MSTSSDQSRIDPESMAALFTAARTARVFRDEPAPLEEVARAYNNARWAPTAFNSQPLRLDLIATPEARDRLLPLVAEVNRPAVASAPLTLVVSADMDVHQSMRDLDAADWVLDLLADSPRTRYAVARDSALLQLGYLIITLRAEGLDVGVMTSADLPGIDAQFHADRPWQSIAIVNVGHGAEDAYRPRGRRHSFDTVARVL